MIEDFKFTIYEDSAEAKTQEASPPKPQKSLATDLATAFSKFEASDLKSEAAYNHVIRPLRNT